MMPRIEETVGTYATSGIASPGQDEWALYTVKINVKPLKPKGRLKLETVQNQTKKY